MRRARKHLAPLVAARLRDEEEHGADWPDRPVRAFTQSAGMC